MPLSSFSLIRQSDGLAHGFVSDGTRFGCLAYRQVGAEVWVQWHPRWGWCMTDTTGEVTGLPLGLPKVDQRHRPPEGAWLNRTGSGSQSYDLSWSRAQPAQAA